jgi:hypothetical protein
VKHINKEINPTFTPAPRNRKQARNARKHGREEKREGI